jgi:phage/conjugal plasmid C-4 type zinc finger TraR family protein
MDAADHAAIEQLRIEKRFEAARQAKAAKPAKPSATDCAECGEVIPEGRRQAIQGVQLCTQCQQQTER